MQNSLSSQTHQNTKQKKYENNNNNEMKHERKKNLFDIESQIITIPTSHKS